jgi:opacity protein-like surface antigen
MKAISPFYLRLLTAALALGSLLPAARAQIPSATEAFSRQNKFDVYGVGQYLHQDETTYNGPYGSTKLKLDDTGLGGIGVAYHFSDYLAVHADFMLGPASFSSQESGGPAYSLGESAFIQSSRINLDYNIINRRLTPFITAGIGYQYFQIDQSYYGYGDYYYGDYYYNNYYSETDFTWNVGVGLRWNITDNFFIKLTGGAQWLQYQDAQNITTQFEASLAIGCTF